MFSIENTHEEKLGPDLLATFKNAWNWVCVLLFWTELLNRVKTGDGVSYRFSTEFQHDLLKHALQEVFAQPY